MRKFKKDIIFYGIIFVFIILKLFLISDLPIDTRYNMRLDDALFIKQANSIIDGNWLGEYNDTTLIKGVFTPIFIVVLYFLKVPFIIGQEIFYAVACVLFITVIKKKIKSRPLLLIMFIIILFNPITYATELCRVYRDNIYTSLVLYLITFTLGIFFNRKESTKKLIKYFVGLGLSFTAMYLCREETLWIIPFILISTIITIGFLLKQEQRKQKLLLYLIPIAIFIIITNTVCLINYKYYGVFELNQYWGTSFKKAYGALTRIMPEEKQEKIPLTRETMHKLYEISPKFKELEPYLEGMEGQEWVIYGDTGDPYEIEGGWLHWAIMEAVEYVGYYENAQKANQFYEDLANEINQLIEDGKLEARTNERVSNTIVTYVEDIPKIITRIGEALEFQYNMLTVKIEMKRLITEGTSTMEEMYERVIIGNELTEETYTNKVSKFKIETLKSIFYIYENLNKYLFYISIYMYGIVIIMIAIKPKENYEEFLILSGLFMVYICRIIIVSYTSQQMYTSALNYSYLACIYGVQYIFGMIGIIFVSKKVKKIFKNKGEKWRKN